MRKLWSQEFLILSVILILFLDQPGYSQSNYRFRRYTKADGFPETVPVRGIFQDGLGFIWFINSYSIDRFDGYSIRTYKHNPEDPLQNLGQQFFDFANAEIDNAGSLWISNNYRGFNNNALLKYDSKLDGFIRYEPDLKGALIGPMTFDSNDTLIWIGGRPAKGLFRFNPLTNQVESYTNDHGDSLTRQNRNRITSIMDRGTFLLLTTWNGLWKFDKKSETFSRPVCNSRDSSFMYSESYTFISKDDPSGNRWIRSIDRLKFMKLDSSFLIVQRFELPKDFRYSRYMLKDGVIWFGSPFHGLFRYDSRDNSFVNIRNVPGDPLSLTDNDVYDLTVDNQNNLWVGTAYGVCQMKNADIRIFNSPAAPTNPIIMDDRLLFGAKNKMWTAPITLQDSIRFQLSEFDYDLLRGQAFHSSWVGKKYLWLTNWGTGVFGIPRDATTGSIRAGGPFTRSPHDPKNPNTITTDSTSVILEDDHENLWVGSYNGFNKIDLRKKYGEAGSVVRFHALRKDSNSIGYKVIRDVATEDENSILVATELGVDLYREGRFHHIFKNHENVLSVFKASDGTLCIGTGDGLYEGRKEGNGYTFVKSDLTREFLGKIIEDKNGRLWTPTWDGILCIDRQQGIAMKFDELDGFIGARPSDFIDQSASGIIVCRFDKGFSMFDPLSLKVSDFKTHPALTKLMVNNKLPIVGNRHADKDDFSMTSDIVMTDELVIDYRHNNFSLEFSAMDMVAPEKNLYRHQLESYDKDWIETDYKNRTATYTNLPSGTYLFRVKASNRHGIWSDNERTLKVIILPPPWRTWWAYAGYSMLVAGLLIWARRNIVSRERLKANLKLEHLELKKAKEVDKVKTSFFTNISHEFRTPLTLIKGPVQDLLEKYTSDLKTQEKLKLVQRNSELLLKLINQLLDLAKLEAGSLKVEKTEGNVFSFVRAVASSFESFAWQKNVDVQIDVPASQSAVLFDKDKLETILINLINNAIKFTPAGGKISVGAMIESNQLMLSVADTGIGIPQEHQSKIFERFHQVSEAHKEVGTGIGLALVKELVALMGGEISVNSEVGKGSEFKVVLPIEVISRQTTSSGQTTIPDSVSLSLSKANLHDGGFDKLNLTEPMDRSKPHVLVVEDNTDLRHFIIESLGNEFHFLEAENGVQGLEKATTEIPDLIISDVMMPEMDGITMAGKIKKDIHTSHIPLILLTAKSSEDSKLSGLQSGADDYLTKPFNKNELLLKVRNGVNRQLKLREKLRAELMSTAPKIEVLSEDEQFLNNVKEKILERLSDEQLSVESLAEDMGMSRVQLYRKISGLTDISVNELIRKLRLQRAAQLLQQNWGPVSQVAYEVGFSNLSYFSKVFKEEFGVLPSEYGAKA